MKLTIKTCYSRVLYLMTSGTLFSQAVASMSIDNMPNFELEGLNGYIETEITLIIKDLKIFTNIWEAYYSLSDTAKLNLYGLAKGLGDRK